MCSPMFRNIQVLFMIHKALRLIRQYHQKSPAQLAHELSISKEKILAIESGSEPVGGKLLEGYSRVFDIPVSSLVFFSESLGKEGRYAQRFRQSLAGKLLDVLQWMNRRNEEKVEA